MPDRADLTVPIRTLNAPIATVKGSSLTMRAALTGCVVALISVFVTALIAIPVAAAIAEKSARESLSSQANVLAAAIRARPVKRLPENARIVEQLRNQDIDAYLISDGQGGPAGLPAELLAELNAGKRVSDRAVLINRRLYMVEGRPVGENESVVLLRTTATGLGRQVLRSLWLPMFAGLTAGVLAGVLLGRRLTRPIRNAAIAAARLSSGDRRVRLTVEPPPEVGRLAVAINDLAEALATSEGRQREFLLSISHELRTPLTSIKGYAEALSDGVVDPDAAPAVGRTILTEAERLDRLVADLLSLARLEAADFAVEPTQVDLGELIKSAEIAFTPRCARHGVHLRVEQPAAPVVIWTDPVRLRQIVDGLMENALRVVPPGKPIVLSVGAGETRAVVEVRDGGPGLTDDDLGVAFERGALHQRYLGVRKVGSGLGLALVAGLARRLGGAIEAGHAPEGGARFTVYLPRTSDSPGASGIAPSS